MPRRIAKHQIEAIVFHAQRGESMRKIQARTLVDRSTIARILRDWGVPVRKARHQLIRPDDLESRNLAGDLTAGRERCLTAAREAGGETCPDISQRNPPALTTTERFVQLLEEARAYREAVLDEVRRSLARQPPLKGSQAEVSQSPMSSDPPKAPQPMKPFSWSLDDGD